MFSRAKWVSQSVRLGLAALIVAGTVFLCPGCSSQKAASGPTRLKAAEVAKIPRPAGNALYRTAHDLALPVELARQGKTFKIPLQSDFDLFSKDALANLSPKDVLIQEVDGKAFFQLKPATKIEFDRGFLILHKGQARFEFKKVDGIFRIRLPQVTLGIRGTTLDVELKSDGSSVVRLIEGTIDVEATAAPKTTLTGGHSLTISATGTLGPVQKLPELNQGTVHPR